MRSPIVARRLPKRFLVLVVLALILPQGFDAVPAPVLVEPTARQDLTHRLNAVLHGQFRHYGEVRKAQMRCQLFDDAFTRSR
jgi:hypothetical protein